MLILSDAPPPPPPRRRRRRPSDVLTDCLSLCPFLIPIFANFSAARVSRSESPFPSSSASSVVRNIKSSDLRPRPSPSSLAAQDPLSLFPQGRVRARGSSTGVLEPLPARAQPSILRSAGATLHPALCSLPLPLLQLQVSAGAAVVANDNLRPRSHPLSLSFSSAFPSDDPTDKLCSTAFHVNERRSLLDACPSSPPTWVTPPHLWKFPLVHPQDRQQPLPPPPRPVFRLSRLLPLPLLARALMEA